MNSSYLKELFRVRLKTLSFLMGFLLLNGGLALYATMYQEPRLASLQDEWANRRRTSGGILQDRGVSFDKGNADLARWRLMIAPKKDLARILTELHDLARSNSLVLGSVSYKPEEIKGENLLSYTLGFTVTGRYGAVKSFLGDLGRYKEMVTINTVSLNNPKLTEEKVDLRLNLTVYLRLEGK